MSEPGEEASAVAAAGGVEQGLLALVRQRGVQHDRVIRQSGDERAAPTKVPLGGNTSSTDSPPPVRQL
eukprot:6874430-Alexandrium_andersonii.AAC.1